jgi:hypothetical protein
VQSRLREARPIKLFAEQLPSRREGPHYAYRTEALGPHSTRWFSSPPLNQVHADGIGFNCSRRDRSGSHLARSRCGVLGRFQRALDKAWKRELAKWMAANSGFIQYATTGRQRMSP